MEAWNSVTCVYDNPIIACFACFVGEWANFPMWVRRSPRKNYSGGLGIDPAELFGVSLLHLHLVPFLEGALTCCVSSCLLSSGLVFLSCFVTCCNVIFCYHIFIFIILIYAAIDFLDGKLILLFWILFDFTFLNFPWNVLVYDIITKRRYFFNSVEKIISFALCRNYANAWEKNVTKLAENMSIQYKHPRLRVYHRISGQQTMTFNNATKRFAERPIKAASILQYINRLRAIFHGEKLQRTVH